MNFLISGANGYLGSRLTETLKMAGHSVFRVIRNFSEKSERDVIHIDDIRNRNL